MLENGQVDLKRIYHQKCGWGDIYASEFDLATKQ